MFARRTRKSIWLALLPLLLLRGLVPAGYMIEANAGGLSIVVCESGIYKDAVIAGSAEHHHHDHHGTSGDTSSAAHDHSICPFAIAAVGAPTPDLPAIVAVVSTEIGRVVDEPVVQSGLFGPSRTQQSRAPPYFS